MINDDIPEQPEQEDEQQSAAVAGADASDNSTRRTKESRVKREAREADAFWKAVFESAVGRREMWRIVASPAGAHAFEVRFGVGPAGVPDSLASWYERGAQDFGLRLYHEWLRREPASVALMHQEHDSRFEKSKRRTSGE